MYCRPLILTQVAASGVYSDSLVGVALMLLLLLNVLDFREARTVKTVMGLVLVSFLFWLKGRSRAGRR
jgi:hypothetical protein